MPATCDVVVLLSGTGSNLQALIDSTRTGDSPARIAAVISNRSDAYGLQRARDAGIATRTLDHKAFEGREAFDSALIELIDTFNPKLVVLAGFMRILSADFVRHYAGRLLNIHPSPAAQVQRHAHPSARPRRGRQRAWLQRAFCDGGTRWRASGRTGSGSG